MADKTFSRRRFIQKSLKGGLAAGLTSASGFATVGSRRPIQPISLDYRLLSPAMPNKAFMSRFSMMDGHRGS